MISTRLTFDQQPELRTHTAASRRTGLALASLLTAAIFALAPPATSQVLPGFAEVVDVRVVNLEVVVEDRRGNRVRGLTAADFELLVDDEPTPISFFSEIDEGNVRADSPTGSSGPAAPSGLEPGKPAPTNYLVFVDDLFTIANDRNRVLEALAGAFENLDAEDRVAMVAFDGNRLDLLTTWTRDRATIQQAFGTARGRPANGLQRLAERRQNDQFRRDFADARLLTIERTLSVGGAVPDEPFARVGLEPEERNFAYRLTGQVERAIVAATSAMRSFVGADGRKVMLLLSGGWPFDPGEFTVGTFSPVVEQATEGTLQSFFSFDLYAPLVDTANLTGFTIYPVDVPGPEARLGLDAGDDASEFGRLNPGANIASTGTPRELQIHGTLDYLADRTGGRALLNAERDRVFDITEADTSFYYWLGFSPDRNSDDRRHSIDVRVKGRPDLRVRTRDSFVDLSPRSETGMVVESALLFGDPPSTKPLYLDFGTPKRSARRLRVALEVGIPMDHIVLVPNQGRFQNRLDIRIAVLSDTGERSDVTLDTITIDGAAPPRPGQRFYYETTLNLRKRPHRIVVAVSDPISGEILSSSGDIDA